MNTCGFEFGDVLFVKSYGLLSRLIRLLIAIRYGLPFKYAWSHVFVAVSDEEGISAEGSGVKFIKLRGNPDLIKADAVGFRFSGGFDEDQIKVMKEEFGVLIGARYGYARYALDFLRVLLFYFALLAFVPAALRPRSLGLWYLGLVAVAVIVEKILVRLDRKSYDCVETVSTILTAGGVWQPAAFRSRSEFPDGMLQTFRVLELNGGVLEVCNKRPGEDFK